MPNKIAVFRSSSKRRANIEALSRVAFEPKLRLALLPNGKRMPVLSSDLKKRLFGLPKERLVER